MKRILIVFTLVIFLLSLSIVKADTNLTSCQRLNTNGETYYLINDILNSSGSNCFWTYNNNNNVLDCLGHTIDGTFDGYYKGIDISESTNNTIRNCIIKEFYYGIYIYTASNNTIINNTIRNNCNYDVSLGSNSNFNVVSNNKIIDGCDMGISIDSGIYNIITNNTIANSSKNIYLSSIAFNNSIYNNIINGSVYVDSTPLNYWNTTKQLGVKVYGIGNVIGGNYWTNSTKNGFSDICNDTDIDYICDDNYTIKTNNIDYLPLTTFIPLPLSLTNYTYTICSDDNILYNHYYNFVNGIANYSDVKFYCPYGCNNITYSCELDPIQSGFLGLGIVISFITILLLIDKWLSKGRK